MQVDKNETDRQTENLYLRNEQMFFKDVYCNLIIFNYLQLSEL